MSIRLHRKSYFVMALLLVTSGIGFPQSNLPESTDPEIIEALINGLHITLDANTGSIIKLQRKGGTIMLEADPEYAGIIDLAYPVKQFDPLRLENLEIGIFEIIQFSVLELLP